ncbi:GTP cyclohydrolase 1 type 2/Nif3 [Cercophora newfieldiana]|uniref:ATP phosphoribosyltransferase n=1 Tax=Cercophora newfieldiana TaxID=92897 RepID=A0AA39XRU6_9PEZI|nr:GTP cyclohydrolase 1 type 2/Nif3 [Cercophora newfieldiana]
MASTVTRFRLVFNVPVPALEACKNAIFAAGAGRYPGVGDYTECCWTVIGTGQFRPGDKANPHIGKAGELEFVQEARVETICVGEEVARKAVAALKSAHPYEEPSYGVYRMEDF